jgi:exodeoxyribonuclease V gamma subunit
VIELEELIRFFRHPARHFCITRLGLALDERDETLEDREPFVLEGLQEHGLRRMLVEEVLAGVPEGQARAVVRASGLLPPGGAGELELGAAQEAVRPFIGRLRPLLEQGSEALEIDLALGGVRLTGWQRRRPGGGLLRYRPARLAAGDRLSLWIAHLAVCACTGPVESLHLASDLDLRLRPVERPAETLEQLLALYRRGLREPLPLFPRTSWAYASTLAARDDAERAEDEARKAWQGSSFSGRAGEGEDPWVRTAFRGREALDAGHAELARAVFEPLIAHAEESPP